MSQTIIDLNQKLLDSIAGNDYELYTTLVDSSITCFEPEAGEHLVAGKDFHKFFFDITAQPPAFHRTTMVNPVVTFLGPDAAMITYVRIVQKVATPGGALTISRSSETRIWKRDAEKSWKHIHFHRSLVN
ncbi:Calcium/calmodulin-dependent protein kinase II, association-domain-containing protein [Polychytrium aggregatum]|uniref:Calcium/calmodulin-dependent protein kinase II, association-domain-containing protein n=1 Tax=Polychytrium aggregatum TaxID=110093 RepID=UPI0022FEEAC2|nr:Calcium/calmodulin-dependent protein kinase II, association-domain-containing protein [Polychytrium aggregatum]KAI9204509.1 Calcium/calmodulin-dependent protein kinase II, association-domain-containing protein [Polychytrium aggregatum]